MPFYEDFSEFERRQNCPKMWIGDGSFYLFENGARSNGALQNYDPPADPKERIELQLQYARIRLKQAEDDFGLLKSIGMGLQQNHFGGFTWDESRLGPEPNGPEYCDPWTGQKLCSKALVRLREIVLERREILSKLTAEYNELPEIKKRRQSEIDARKAKYEAELAHRAEVNACAEINI